MTTSAIKPGVSESAVRSPETYKQFQTPSSTAMKMEYDGSASASRYGTPGTRDWKREEQPKKDDSSKKYW